MRPMPNNYRSLGGAEQTDGDIGKTLGRAYLECAHYLAREARLFDSR
jgi:hypothetical protein